MPLFQQKYPNNIRTIGSVVNPNIVFPDDVTLLCDTTLGAVNILLQPIPYQQLNPLDPPNLWVGFYNTQYQLYVVDYGNNSTVNNITISAPVGFTINGQPSVTLASNGASYLIVVGSQTNYLALYGGMISGASPLLISLTNAQLLTLINTNTVVAGQFYLVTDALGTDGGVIVQGSAINGSSVNGTGLYYNADYQSVGTYTPPVSILPATNNIWWNPAPPNPAPPVFGANNVVIWNNTHYRNNTNTWQTALGITPDADPVVWTPLAKSSANGYIRVADHVRYNVLTNRVVYRADSLGNEVDWFNNGVNDSIADFQWGRNQVTNNKIRSNSYMVATNSYTVFNANELSENSTINDTTGLVAIGAGSVSRNKLSNGSNITNVRVFDTLQIADNFLDTGSSILTGICTQTTINNNRAYTNGKIRIDNSSQLTFDNNFVSANGEFRIENNTPPSLVQYCEVSDITARYRLLNENLQNKKCRTGFSNFATTIDCSLPPIVGQRGGFIGSPTNTLYIDAVYEQHYGIINLSRFSLAFGNNILRINGATLNHPITFYPDFVGGGSNVPFTTTGIGVAGADDLVSNLVAGSVITLSQTPSSLTIFKPRTPSFNIITNYNLIL